MSDVAAILKEKDEIINQVMAEGRDAKTLILLLAILSFFLPLTQNLWQPNHGK